MTRLLLDGREATGRLCQIVDWVKDRLTDIYDGTDRWRDWHKILTGHLKLLKKFIHIVSNSG